MKILKIKDFLIVTLVVLMLMRIAIIGLSADMASFAGKYFLFRQTIYTFAWASLLWFLLELTLQGSDTLDKVKVTKMKNASFWAMIACFLKFGVTILYQLSYRSWPSAITLAYIIVEILAWLLLTIFMFLFWRWKKKQEEKVE